MRACVRACLPAGRAVGRSAYPSADPSGVAGLSLLWKLFVFDPLKSLCCGPILEPLSTFLCGGGAGDIALNTILEDLDGRIEELGEQVLFVLK